MLGLPKTAKGRKKRPRNVRDAKKTNERAVLAGKLVGLKHFHRFAAAKVQFTCQLDRVCRDFWDSVAWATFLRK